jgi:hypothetical protein
MNWSYIIAAAIAAIPGIVAAFHARKAKQTAQSVNVKVNGNVARLLDILSSASIEIPHDVAAKVIAAPPVSVPEDASSDEIIAQQFAAKLGKL